VRGYVQDVGRIEGGVRATTAKPVAPSLSRRSARRWRARPGRGQRCSPQTGRQPGAGCALSAPVELWDTSMTCLTILLDPGRLKRGVGPNRMLGPPLKVGERYILAVGPGMIDVHGRPLRQRFTKAFTVCEAVRAPIEIEDWRIVPPTADSRDPLDLTFPTPLNWAGLWQAINVVLEGGEQISGRVGIKRNAMAFHTGRSVASRPPQHPYFAKP